MPKARSSSSDSVRILTLPSRYGARFTEMCQFFGSLTAWAGETQGRFATVCRNMDPGMARWLSSGTSASQPQMMPVNPVRKVQDLPAYRSDSLLGDIQILVSRLAASGHEVLALDCTQPDVGMPVARVFVPGLYVISGHASARDVYTRFPSSWVGWRDRRKKAI